MFDLGYTTLDQLKKGERRWVCWKKEPKKNKRGEIQYEEDGKTPKMGKVLKNPHSGNNGSSTDAQTWGSYEEAAAAVKKYSFDGIGFVLGDDYAGIDLDDCFTPDAKLYPLAEDVLSTLSDTYCEYSPSGNGLHLLFLTSEQYSGITNTPAGFESYSQGRYFTITEKPYNGKPHPLTDCTDRVLKLNARYKTGATTKKSQSEDAPDLFKTSFNWAQPSQDPEEQAAASEAQFAAERALEAAGLTPPDKQPNTKAQETDFLPTPRPLSDNTMTMTPRQAVQWIHEHPEVFLGKWLIPDNYTQKHPAKSILKMSCVCPGCGSGSHSPEGDGMKTKDGARWWCGVCDNGMTGKGSDIIDLARKADPSLNTYSKALRAVCDYASINLDTASEDFAPDLDVNFNPQPEAKPPASSPLASGPLSDGFKAYHEKLKETDYPAKRGLSEGICDRFLLGYDPKEQVIIIPKTGDSYTARKINETEKKDRYVQGGREDTFFHQDALFTDSTEPLFVCEGEFDALSVLECGYDAVALGGLKVETFAALAASSSRVLLIALDTDKPGQKAASRLAYMLEPENYIVNIAGIYKDANEHLTEDRQGLEKALAEAVQAKNRALEEYYKHTASAEMSDYLDRLERGDIPDPIPSGFTKLDEMLGGGIRAQFVVIAAIPSLGKSAYVLQLADQYARQGQDVLFFTLEMSREEVLVRSLSRYTRETQKAEALEDSYAKTIYGLNTPKTWRNYSEEMKAFIHRAEGIYKKTVQDRVFFVTIPDLEKFSQNASDAIFRRVKQHIQLTGRIPIVFVDYLQYIPSPDPRYTDKQAVDANLRALKNIVIKLKSPVFAVCSNNRKGYSQEAAMEALKESGNIEYTADVIIFLQFYGTGANQGTSGTEKKNTPPQIDFNAEKRKPERTIEAVILKNRNGKTGESLYYRYEAAFNVYEEVESFRNNAPSKTQQERDEYFSLLATVKGRKADGETVFVRDLAQELDLPLDETRSRLKYFRFTIDKDDTVSSPLADQDEAPRQKARAELMNAVHEHAEDLEKLLNALRLTTTQQLERKLRDFSIPYIMTNKSLISYNVFAEKLGDEIDKAPKNRLTPKQAAKLLDMKEDTLKKAIELSVFGLEYSGGYITRTAENDFLS